MASAVALGARAAVWPVPAFVTRAATGTGAARNAEKVSVGIIAEADSRSLPRSVGPTGTVAVASPPKSRRGS